MDTLRALEMALPPVLALWPRRATLPATCDTTVFPRRSQTHLGWSLGQSRSPGPWTGLSGPHCLSSFIFPLLLVCVWGRELAPTWESWGMLDKQPFRAGQGPSPNFWFNPGASRPLHEGWLLICIECLTGKQPGQLAYMSVATFPVHWPKLKTVTIQPLAERNSLWVWAGGEKLGRQEPSPTGTTQGSPSVDGPVTVRPEPRQQGNVSCLLLGTAGGALPSRPGAPDLELVPFSNLLGGWGPVSWEVISHTHDLPSRRKQRW